MNSSYKKRHINFLETHTIDDWKVKCYGISKHGHFDQDEFYANALKELPAWLTLKNGFEESNDKIAFLILHAGTEGIFTLINWMVGSNMLNTHIFLTQYDQMDTFNKVSGQGFGPCIWELEVINFERVSWTEHILKSSTPNYEAYLMDHFNAFL